MVAKQSLLGARGLQGVSLASLLYRFPELLCPPAPRSLWNEPAKL